MVKKNRFSIFDDILVEVDEMCILINEYDSQLHDYNGVELYQAESQMVKIIGDFPGISAIECAKKLKKTSSACSQIVRKLRNKGWIKQERNELNNRVYNLYLTDSGKELYKNHRKFEDKCLKRTFKLLEPFDDKDLKKCSVILKALNKGFLQDVEDGKILELDE
ncbi:DNA-binding MarR family transcriptional regulator [Bacilli bacterium PM5-3]|nr:DNA-binding MarR family transcriptional regulator [Bacilli bacterium PM5-3]MDH6603014.1 DNA-binding MarR family transcriptional regulator [Bacilli bacterium PM5-9]